MALVIRGYPKGVLFHSDRGSQHCSYAFRDIINEYEFSQSMSRKGNCWDNAVAESFFKTLKSEETDDRCFNTIEEAKRVVFNYIEIYYNRQRMHSSIQYQIPAEYETQWLMKNLLRILRFNGGTPIINEVYFGSYFECCNINKFSVLIGFIFI